jgi:quercetin dioxygenase-like cupin family protein
MHVTRFDDAKTYEAAKHFGTVGFRLQGFEASPTTNFWVGLSHFLPGGGAELSSSPLERVYVGHAGTVTIISETGEVDLKPLDSLHIAPGEKRSIINRTNDIASMLVIMPYPEGTKRP